VTARDQFDNPVPGVTVTLTANPTTGNTLTQPSGPTNASGVATGTLSSTEAGDKVVSAMAGGISITQTATVTVTAGAVSASQSTVTASPTSIQASAGAVISTITVTARDANNNPIQGATVTLTATGSGNTLTQPTLPTDVNGQRTGTLSSTATADKVVSATAGGTPITQTATVTVTAGAATKLAFTEQPSNTTAGATISPPVQVTVQDQFDNTVTGFTGNVRVRIGTNPGGGTLGGTTMVGAVGGVATFGDLAIDKAANGYTLETTSGSLTLDTGEPGDDHAAAVGVGAERAGIPAAAGGVGGGCVGESSERGERDGGDCVGGPRVGWDGDGGDEWEWGGGVYTNLAITGAVGIRTLDFTVGALTPVVSDPINITAGAASQLVFTVDPTDTQVNVAIAPPVQVTAHDDAGNRVTSFTGTVTIAIGTNPSGGTLSGTTAVLAVSGVATFNNLLIDTVGNGYTLTADSGTLAQGTSATFNIIP
jgi:hypothetical protein